MREMTTLLAILSFLFCSCSDDEEARVVCPPVAQDGPLYFYQHQGITTDNPQDVEYFEIAGNSYLAAANQHNNITSNVDSKIYRWNDTSFVEIQSIPTHWATDWEYFSIGTDHFLQRRFL